MIKGHKQTENLFDFYYAPSLCTRFFKHIIKVDDRGCPHCPSEALRIAVLTDLGPHCPVHEKT